MLYMILPVVAIITLIINLVLPDKAFSGQENRSLAQLPKLSFSTIASGDFFTDFNSWFSDQFVGRSFYREMDFLLKRGEGLREINDVFIGKGTLLYPIEYNPKTAQANIDAINTFASLSGLPTNVVIADAAASIESNRLPTSAPRLTTTEFYKKNISSLEDSVHYVDINKSLKKHADEYIFYKSDHHWTSLGAFYGFQTFASDCLETQVSKKDYNIMQITDDFQGTLFYKTGDFLLKDNIDIYVPTDNPDYVVTKDNKKSRSIYDEKKLKSNNQYEVFLGANQAVVKIEMDNDSNRRLLLFKDSYANSFIQFLLPYYREITIVDPRYYYGSINELVQQNYPTEVLFLYCFDIFNNSDSLSKVMDRYAFENQPANEETDE